MKGEKVAGFCPRDGRHDILFSFHRWLQCLINYSALVTSVRKHLWRENRALQFKSQPVRCTIMLHCQREGFRVRGRVCDQCAFRMAERETEPFVMVTSDLSVQGCRNYISSPLNIYVCKCVCVSVCVCVCVCAHGGNRTYFLVRCLPESQRSG